MILGRLWMKKHGVLLDMINNSIIFFLGYWTHFGIPLSPTPPKSKETRIISKAKYENIVLDQILKSGSNKNLNDFSRKIQKLSNKKRRLINAFE